MRVYLDTCCYNRPYDDQSQLRISLEAQAKLYIQEKIRKGELELATSYILFFENSMNPYPTKNNTIKQFLSNHSCCCIESSRSEEVEQLAAPIRATGVNTMDALHVACALIAKCDCFFTTDQRLLKYKTDKMMIMNPIDYIRLEGGEKDE